MQVAECDRAWLPQHLKRRPVAVFEPDWVSIMNCRSFGARILPGLNTHPERARRLSTLLTALATSSALYAPSASAQQIGPGTINSTVAVNSGASFTVSPLTISTIAGFALHASGTAQVDFQPGAVLLQTTGNGTGSHGLFASDTAAITGGNGLSIFTSGTSAAGLAATDSATVTLSGTTIHTTGGATASGAGVISAYGIVNSLNSVVRFSNGSITTDGAAAIGVLTTGGTIVLGNTTIQTNALTSAINGVRRFGAVGLRSEGGQITANGGSVTTQGELGFGVDAASAGTATLSNMSITTRGSGAVGANVSDAGSSIALTNVGITTSGAAADGLRAGLSNPGGTITMNGGSVAVSGVSAYGAAAYGTGAIITLDGVNLTASGLASNGLYAPGSLPGGVINAFNSTISASGNTGSGGFAQGTGSTINVNNTRVDTNRSSGFGLRALSNAFVNATNGSSIITRQANSSGIFADQTSFGTISNSSIQTLGNFSFGIYSQAGSVVQAQNATITTQGASGNGLYTVGTAPGTRIVGDTTTVETFGADAHAARTIFGSEITLTNSSLTTHGTGAHGVDMYAASGVANTFSATSTTISSSATTLNVWGGVGNITLNNVQTSSGTGQFLTVGLLPVAPSFFAAADPDYTPPVVPASPSNPVVVNLTASGSTLNGNSFVAAGDTANVTFQNATTLTGAFTTQGTTNMSLLSGSVWNMTASSNVTDLTNSASLIDFAAPSGGAFKTLTTVNYLGAGGAIGLNTFLGTDGSPSDRLVIAGGTATGNTSLRISNAGGLGAQTTGNGIMVVDAINGGTTASAAFALARPVFAGPYEYSLFRSSVDASNSQAWYLRSTIDCNIAPNDPVCQTPTPPPNPVPDYRAETSLYAAIPAMTLLYGRNLLDTLHERVGDEEDIRGGGSGGGVWGRIIGMSGRRNGEALGIYEGDPKYKYDFLGLQVGHDVWRREHSDGSRDHVGVYVAGGGARGRVTHVDSITGNADFQGYSVGGYWTHFGTTGWYVDTVLQGTWYDISSTANRGLTTLATNGAGIAGSVEGGYPIKLSRGFFIEPQAQITFQRIDLDDSSDSAALVKFANVDSLAGRIGARFGRTWALDGGPNPRTLTAWIRPSVWHEFRGNPLTEFSSDAGFIPFRAGLQGTWGELNAGISGQINRTTTLFANASYQSRFESGSYAYNGKLGVRVNW